MTKVKLCGLSRESDIAAVNKLKPDLVGFVFAKRASAMSPPSRRNTSNRCSPPAFWPLGCSSTNRSRPWQSS